MSTLNLISHRLLAAAVLHSDRPVRRPVTREKPGLFVEPPASTFSLELLQPGSAMRAATARPLRTGAWPLQ